MEADINSTTVQLYPPILCWQKRGSKMDKERSLKLFVTRLLDLQLFADEETVPSRDELASINIPAQLALSTYQRGAITHDYLQYLA